MTRAKRTAFTLVEVLIVVVIMAVLAATIIPQFADSTKDAKEGTARFNLRALRSQIELYKSQHDSRYPSQDLSELITTTNVTGDKGTGADYPYGPYIHEIPINPFNNSATVVAPAAVPPAATVDGAGWLFDTGSGKIWLNHEDFLDK